MKMATFCESNHSLPDFTLGMYLGMYFFLIYGIGAGKQTIEKQWGQS